MFLFVLLDVSSAFSLAEVTRAVGTVVVAVVTVPALEVGATVDVVTEHLTVEI